MLAASAHSRLYSQFRKLRFCLPALLIVISPWLSHTHAQDTLEITNSPLVIESAEPVQLIIKKGADPLSGDATKFSPVENDLVVFDPATLNVTPKKSGKGKLTITYKASADAAAISKVIDVTVKYKQVSFLTSVVAPNQTVNLLEGQSLPLRVEAIDIKGEKAVGVIVEPVIDNTDALEKLATTPPSVKARPVNGETQATITLKVDEQEYQKVTVKITEAIERIDILEGEVVRTPVDQVIRVSMPEGTSKTLTIRPVDDKGKAYPLGDRRVTVSDPTNGLLVTSVEGDKIQINAQALADQQPPVTTSSLSITADDQGTGGQDTSTTIEVTVLPRNSFIELRTYPSNFLLPTGRISIPATVRRRLTAGAELTEVRSAVMNFDFRAGTKARDQIWVSLTQEGNTATVVWREPSESELTAAYNDANARRPSEIIIVAKAEVAGQNIESQVVIRMGRAAKFQLLDVKMNVMDARTVNDLYGGVTNDEYYVMNVRLFNNLKDPDSKEYIGTSILAYSSSIEIAVGLEKKFDNDSNSHFDNVISGSKAKQIAKKRAQAAAELAEAEADFYLDKARKAQGQLKEAYTREYEAQQKRASKEAKARQLNEKARATGRAADLEAANKAIREFNLALEDAQDAADNTIRVRDEIGRSSNTPIMAPQDAFANLPANTAVDDSKWHAVTNADLDRIAPAQPFQPRRGDFMPELTQRDIDASRFNNSAPNTQAQATVPEPEPTCKGAIKYRPLTFEMMVNTVDRRDGRSKRNIAFKLLEAAGTGASFITSIAVPPSGNDLLLGLDKYRNLLIPGLDRLVPSLKEQQRQNIVSQAMKEIEEIPFGSDITRVLFIPKKSIRGLIRGHESRISEVCPYYFKVEVAIIQKGGSVQTGTISR